MIPKQILLRVDAPTDCAIKTVSQKLHMTSQRPGSAGYFVVAAMALACSLLGPEPAGAQAGRIPTIVTVCAPCHGVKGDEGDVEKPNLAGQKSIYLRKQLLAFRAGKRKHPDMKSIGRDLTDREIDQLVVYYSTLPAR
jgi:cytochrome c553